MNDTFRSYSILRLDDTEFGFHSLQKLETAAGCELSRLPFSIRILIEALLRNCDGNSISEENVLELANWKPSSPVRTEIGFMPARVLLQDFTGVPAIVDLAALRSAMHRLGGDPKRINPSIPVDLVIDHSVQVDKYGSDDALLFNAEREFERNRERYEFLRWGQGAFDNLSVVPPATGIVHQVNLEYLAKVVQTRVVGGQRIILPDTLVGTDSHTTMINGLGVLAWGVGGIEAEVVMLGQPIYMLAPDVIGFKLGGALQDGVTATDLVLTVTQMLRAHGVVGKFVEFYGSGLSRLTLADRATIANMAPEYGATVGYFPVDAETLAYLQGTGREEALVSLVEGYFKEQGLFRTDETPDPTYTETLELDMNDVESSVAGPKRPQDRVALSDVKNSFLESLTQPQEKRGFGLEKNDLNREIDVKVESGRSTLRHGSVVIAAITSCTNTSNPSVMIGAGLLAKKAVEKGLSVPPHVKTSLAPGSKVVEAYLRGSGLLPYLEKLGFNVVGFGCTTCIGNSGPLPEPVAEAVRSEKLVAAAVLSGNRNFEGRVNPLVKAAYLASPPLVVAYALAGRMDVDLAHEVLGEDDNGKSIYMKDIWPSQKEIRDTIAKSLRPEIFREQYGSVYDGNPRWNAVEVTGGDIYEWDDQSSYIREPSFFADLAADSAALEAINDARVLALLGDSVTTDHISPAGAIAADSPAARYLNDRGIERRDFNTYGSRRGNHEVMMRGTFGNIRIKNRLLPDSEGGVTEHLPTGDTMSIYDAAMKYKSSGTPLIVIAGKDYGMGSSRDWAAKGTFLLGVKAVVFESIERIHRSNLIGMGVLPLQFMVGENAATLGLTGRETYTIECIDDKLAPGQSLAVIAKSEFGDTVTFDVTVRIDTHVELDYYKNGGILQLVLRRMLRS
ncbi:MAG: aconitate hydratase AcnA [candidate division Zixibacteria bacterium]|nr:aconitate hydratase AcnA [candidate division Zixibacteria bacterium]MBU1469150.1 aconitate hydratase AcnA [candidate division Zixibacteria bacterium]MBU2625971.1 aconitate hydratase AcnA [candidate division Zixibacteria bacterium]